MNIYKAIIAVIASISLALTTVVPANAEEAVRKKATFNQSIKTGRWVTLDFKGNDYLKGNGNRSLFCYQAGIDTKGKAKPKMIKMRLARLKPGRDNTTATSTYYIGSKPKKELVFSNCWAIETLSNVVVQIKITGGSKAYNSDIRQFKMWTPGANYPADFSDFIPEGTL